MNTDNEEVVLPGILESPVQWFISIPKRTLLLCMIALIVPFGTLLVATVAMFATLRKKEE